MSHLNAVARTLGLVGLISAFVPDAGLNLAQAATTQWQETTGGRLRLISGGMQGDALKAGLEIDLDEGWKTYWKVPGDAGIPPILDLSASTNIASYDIRWPVPKRIDVAGSEILGYKDAIIFPLLITPADPGKPVHLVINAMVGLCSDLCVPLSADLALDISKGGDRDLGAEMLIDRDMALVPAAPTSYFGIQSLSKQAQENGPDRLLIKAQIPDGYGHKDLFVEGPENWFLPLTKALSEENDTHQQFELLLDGLPQGVQSKGATLTFTLTNGDEAVEQTITLED